MSPKTTNSVFGSIHLTLAIIALSVVGGFYVLAEIFVAPKLVEDRAQSAFSVIRSHEVDIILNKTRAVRDELLASKAIKDDQQFSHYFSDERAKIEPLISTCHFVTPTICLSPSVSVFSSPIQIGRRTKILNLPLS